MESNKITENKMMNNEIPKMIKLSFVDPSLHKLRNLNSMKHSVGLILPS